MFTIPLRNWLSIKGTEIPQLYLVGGTVRDLLLNCAPKDLDLVCRNAKELAFSIALQKNAALVPMEKKPDEPCYRIVDRENPDSFLDIAEMRGSTIHEDLTKRDFTINSIAVEVNNDGSLGEFVDPLNGAEDIERKIIKVTNDESLVSDPLRILRAIRLAATLDFTIEQSTLEDMQKSAPLLRNVSVERIVTELFLILRSSSSSQYFRQMDQLGMLDVIFPEVISMKGCLQNGFHRMDVWEHSMTVMENCEHVINDLSEYFGALSKEVENTLNADNRVPLLKLAALLHDIGKPATSGINADSGRITFYGHDEEGARLVDLVARRLKMSTRNKELLVLLVEDHLNILNLSSKGVRSTTIMKWFRKMGDHSVPTIILSMADVMSIPGPDATAEYREHYINWAKKSIRDYYERIKARIESPILVTGNDLLALGMEPGPEIGKILAQVRSAQDTGKINSREEAMDMAKGLITPGITP